MALNILELEKVKHRGTSTIARCPACAENGRDRKGDHLFINCKGGFGCIIYPSEEGKLHRKRIFELVGLKKEIPKTFKIRRAEER